MHKLAITCRTVPIVSANEYAGAYILTSLGLFPPQPWSYNHSESSEGHPWEIKASFGEVMLAREESVFSVLAKAGANFKK